MSGISTPSKEIKKATQPPFSYANKIEYLKGTALYFAASFSASLNLYNFGTLKFIGFLADTVKDLCKRSREFLQEGIFQNANSKGLNLSPNY
ncbi:hypothetical protein NQ317_001795 [Molorchus minor]|uniref:Uncharacterized protein n=1 Tax=Molorchus minor TaxID=1323400 RepID=A0ABQ9IUB3_9CUCU|nr:hypothetical protein NQ317_001795 [Molorchus minor]